MTDEGTVRVGPKGQVVIPKAIRDAIGIRPGERVRVTRQGRQVQVERLRALSELRGIFAGVPGGTGDVEEEHRRELEREERRAAER